jgi:hypothetical protein
MQKRYHENRGTNTEYERVKLEEQLQQFEQEWNDKEFRNVKELADKLVRVMSKYKRRKPIFGLQKEVMCEVMFPSYWNLSATQVIDDMIKSRKDTQLIQNKHKEILFLYIPSVIDAFRGEYRRRARNRFDGLVDAVNHKYAGHEKLCATPPYEDPKTKRREMRWYLLSDEQELNERNASNENKKIRIDFNMDAEARVVDYQEQREQELREKAIKKESEKDPDSNNKENEGGE